MVREDTVIATTGLQDTGVPKFFVAGKRLGESIGDFLRGNRDSVIGNQRARSREVDVIDIFLPSIFLLSVFLLSIFLLSI
jgi:hypothetical protein